MKFVKLPLFDDSGREWTKYDCGWGWWVCGSWFLNEMDWQPTLFKKIKKWLELEYKFFFTPKGIGLGGAKVPTPLSKLRWRIEYNFWGRL